MATVNDETILNAMNSQANIDEWNATNFDAITLNDSSSPSRLYRDGGICGQMIIKSSTDGYWVDDITSLDVEGSGIGGKNKIVVMWVKLFKPSVAFLDEVLVGIYDVIGGQGGTTPDGGRWDFKPKINEADQFGWFPCAFYPSQPDEDVDFGNCNLNAILSLELSCNNGSGSDVKLAGMERSLALSYVGGHSVTVTLALLTTESVSNNLGVFFEKGISYRATVNIRIGDASATAATIFSPVAKILHFDNLR